VAKDSPMIQLQRLVESWGQKALQKIKQTPILSRVFWKGFKKKSPSLIQEQAPAYSVVKHVWNFKWDEVHTVR